MTGTRAAARFWAGKSAFEEEAARDRAGLPFALVAAGTTAGREVGRAPSALPARSGLGEKGLPPLRLPIILDASPLREGSPKGWAAVARGAAAAGAALAVSPTQLKQREAVLKAAGVPLLLRTQPGNPIPPEAARASAALAPSLATSSGAPALLAEDALAGLVEALRALTEYRAGVVLVAPPGRMPSAAGLRQAALAGALGICAHEGEGPLKLPFAALAGQAAAVRATGLPLAAFFSTDGVLDGIDLACALAAGGGLLATSLPLRLALAEEATTDADWKTTGDRLGQALRVWWEDAQRASGAVGVRDPRDLAPGNLRATTYDAAALSGLRLAGYDERLPWWTH